MSEIPSWIVTLLGKQALYSEQLFLNLQAQIEEVGKIKKEFDELKGKINAAQDSPKERVGKAGKDIPGKQHPSSP